MHKTLLLIAAASVLALTLLAGQDFSGKWEFNPSRSQNVGMMADMKLTATVKQTAQEMTIVSASTFNGQQQTSETHLDLTGKPVSNQSPMEGASETVTKWDGNHLVTTWTSPGSIAGTKSVRTETRSLSGDGKTMTVESSRAKGPSMVMVYERK